MRNKYDRLLLYQYSKENWMNSIDTVLIDTIIELEMYHNKQGFNISVQNYLQRTTQLTQYIDWRT